MKAHIVVAHPEPKSFNGLMAQTSSKTLRSQGWDVTLSDLYAMGFDPCEGPRHYTARSDPALFHAQTEQRFSAENGHTPADVEAETQRLIQSDLLIVHFPLWWFGAPAILKGWIDRVFVYGAIYRSAMRYDTGLLKGKKMIACVTTGSSREACSHNGREGDTRLHLWPLLYSFRYIGLDVLEPKIFNGIGGTAFMEGLENGLNGLAPYTGEWEQVLGSISDRKITPYNVDNEYDESSRLVADADTYSPFVSHRSQTPWD